jgi:hypothetical protein
MNMKLYDVCLELLISRRVAFMGGRTELTYTFVDGLHSGLYMCGVRSKCIDVDLPPAIMRFTAVTGYNSKVSILSTTFSYGFDLISFN